MKPPAKRATKKHGARISAAATRKVIVDFPAGLYEQTEAAARELSTNRSRLVRSAVEQYLKMLQRRKLEQSLIDGYRQNADLDRKIAADFVFVDAENL